MSPKISYDKKVEENNKNILSNKHDFENNIRGSMYKYFEMT